MTGSGLKGCLCLVLSGAPDPENLLRLVNWNCLLLGAVLALLVYNAILGLFFRDRLYGLYLVYLSVLALATGFITSGPAFVSNPVRAHDPDLWSLWLVSGVAQAAFVAFSRHLVETHRRFPILDRVLMAMALLCVGASLLFLVLESMVMEFVLTGTTYGLVLVMAWTTVKAIKQGFTPARYCLAAQAARVGAWTTGILAGLGLIPMGMVTALVWMTVGSALDLLFLSMALTDRIRRMKQKKLRMEAQFKTLFNTVSDLVFTLDMDGGILTINPAVERDMGCKPESLAGNRVTEFMDPEYRDLFFGQILPDLKQHGRRHDLMVLRDRAGREHFLEYRAALETARDNRPVITGMGRLVTGRIREEQEIGKVKERLVQSQKMETIGTLTSGIAHDFNNLLHSVITGLDLLCRVGELNPRQNHFLDIVRTSADRGKEVVASLASLNHKREVVLKPVSLEAVVRETAGLLEKTINRMIILETLWDDQAAWISGDASQLHQVMMNLGLNARDAMPDGGLLRFEVFSADASPVQNAQDPDPGHCCVVRVTDTGHGMTQEVQQNIFTPFFTTKGVGKGTGLGLAMVHDIVTAHRGSVTCTSTPGKGTVFTLVFPSLEQPAEEELSPEPCTGSPVLDGTGKTVLVVDDEADIREVICEILLMHGFSVLTASDGARALVLYQTHAGEIDLIILDLDMPVMGGLEFLEQIRRQDNQVKVVISTGAIDTLARSEPGLARANDIITKPYTAAVLLKTLGALL